MTIKTKLGFLFFIIMHCTVIAQLQTLKGVVIASEDVEGIHILNKTSVKYTVTDTDGTFQILAKANDTLTISSLKYETKDIIITKASLSISNLTVFLVEKVNQLDEVVVGKILTGSLANDMSTFGKAPEINFYDLGIPGFFGKPKTINERKLADADGAGWGAVSGGPFGGGLSLDVNKLINRISGRTKKLRAIVAIDEKEKCRKQLKSVYSELMFKNMDWSETAIADYFYFCMDDANFEDICNQNDPREILPFLKHKLTAYKTNLSLSRD